MAKILDFFSRKKNPKKVTVISKPTLPSFLTMDHIGGVLYQSLQPHIDFTKWSFIQELFHIPVTRIKFVDGEIQTDVQQAGLIVTALVNIETHELKLFEVKPLIKNALKHIQKD